MEENDTSFPLIWIWEERRLVAAKGHHLAELPQVPLGFFLFVYILHKNKKKFFSALKWRNNR